MSAFLKIDECQGCHRSLPWEWLPTVTLNGKALAGTGVWCSAITDGLCADCLKAAETRRWEEHRASARRAQLIELLGGEKPFREFTVERYAVSPGNRLAHDNAKGFDPSTDNLYLWGACGVGKTHLAWAAARRCIDESLSVTIVHAGQLSRKLRMKDPADEEAAMAELVEVDCLVLDDIGAGVVTPFARQILQEILDARDFHDQAGLIATSRFSLDELAAHLEDDAIPSRLAGMCAIVQIIGPDRRTLRNPRP